MEKIVLTQTYEITLPEEYKNKSYKDLLNDLNRMYDIYGRNIIQALSIEDDYVQTELVEIDDEYVYMEDNEVNNSGGYNIILDGQQLEGDE